MGRPALHMEGVSEKLYFKFFVIRERLWGETAHSTVSGFEVLCSFVEDAGNLGSDSFNCNDCNDCNQSDDETVFNHTLAALIFDE